jgi:hypothetical protein
MDDGAVVCHLAASKYIETECQQTYQLFYHSKWYYQQKMLGTLSPFLQNQTSVGANTFAVEIHQVSANSSDISFDFRNVLQPAPPIAKDFTSNELIAKTILKPLMTKWGESSDWIEVFNMQK